MSEIQVGQINSTDGSTAITVSTGNTTLSGSLAMGANNISFSNGNGIDFSASEGSGADSSVLDDYEEGTWTPTGVSGGTWTSISNANYVKVGSIVFAKFQANLDSDGPGTATFGGLPFAVADTQGGGMGLGNPNYDFLGAQVQTTETVVIRHGLDTNNRSIRLSVIYYTSS